MGRNGKEGRCVWGSEAVGEERGPDEAGAVSRQWADRVELSTLAWKGPLGYPKDNHIHAVLQTRNPYVILNSCSHTSYAVLLILSFK